MVMLVLLAGAIPVAGAPGSAGAALPAGFQETTAFSGLTNPTVVRFASDGRVFVAEQTGRIKVFDDLQDPSPTLFADLSGRVQHFWDRGMLGMALDPQFPTRPYVYVSYTHDAAIGGTAPRWGDTCPTPPGATGDGCVVSGRLSKLTASGSVMTGPEQVLIEDWCQQYPSHSIGALAFGPDGALYMSGGDGASFGFGDYGQDGSPLNPCGDPPTGVGGTQTIPTAEGGALRSQDLRTGGDPVSLDGSVIRVNPDTGAALPDNPLAGNADLNARRIVAYGLRNPFRFTFRPGTSELWIGDVGWGNWEEIDRVVNPLAATLTNFGWPCREGPNDLGNYRDLNICIGLPVGATTGPHFTYLHSDKVVAGETCGTGISSISGLAFYNGGSFPAAYNGALFFADYSRNCIWVMFPGTGGVPNPATRQTFLAPAAGPVDLVVGPGGDLFYPDLSGGTVRRIRYLSSNNPPTAVATASPTSGPPPLAVNFDGRGSSDPDAGDTLGYEWDLDGDGQYDDSTSSTPSRTYTALGSTDVRLRVTDSRGASDVSDPITIRTDANTAPQATIASPAASLQWRPGQQISFSGSATDAQQGTLPASALSWSLDLHHCAPDDPGNCHVHELEDFAGVASGSFSGQDHEYPSHLELTLARHRRRRPDRHRDGEARPADRPADLHLGAARARGVRGRQHGHHAVQPHRDPRLDELDQHGHAAVPGQRGLGVLVLVGRRRAQPRHRRAGLGHHVHGALRARQRPAGAGPGGGLRLRRGHRPDGRRPLAERQHGHDLRGHAGARRALRRRALVRRRERLGHGSRCAFARPDHRDDARGLGPPDRRRLDLAHADPEGAGGEPHLRALLQRGQRAAVGSRVRGRRRPRHARNRARGAQCLDASGQHLRRLDVAPVRERRAGVDPRPGRPDRRIHRSAAHRRQRRLARVVPGADRRGAGLQPGSDAGRDPVRHEHPDRGAGAAGHAAAHGSAHPLRHGRARAGQPRAGVPRPTTWASRATTSTAPPRPASRLRRPTGSPRWRATHTSTRRSRPAPTTTGCWPRTRRAT